MIGGNNYFKLRDMAKVFNIGVGYDVAKVFNIGVGYDVETEVVSIDTQNGLGS